MVVEKAAAFQQRNLIEAAIARDLDSQIKNTDLIRRIMDELREVLWYALGGDSFDANRKKGELFLMLAAEPGNEMPRLKFFRANTAEEYGRKTYNFGYHINTISISAILLDINDLQWTL